MFSPKKLAGLLVTVFLFGFALAPAVQASGLSSTQISAVLSLLQSFGADQVTINNVSVALGGNSNTHACAAITHNFGIGATDASVGGDLSRLITFLDKANYFGDARIDGTFNEQTSASLRSWQKSVGLDGVGVVGPKTRAAIDKACNSVSPTPATQLRAKSDMPSVTYSYRTGPGDATYATTTESAFGEGVVVDPTKERAPTSVAQQGNTILRMLYVDKALVNKSGGSYPAVSDAMFEGGTVYLWCTYAPAKAVGVHVILPANLIMACNPGAEALITRDGKDIPLSNWAAN